MYLVRTTMILEMVVLGDHHEILLNLWPWLDLATCCQVRSIPSTRTKKCNTSQDDPFLDPDNFDHQDIINIIIVIFIII